MEKYSSAEAAWEAQETKKKEKVKKNDRRKAVKNRPFPFKKVFMLRYSAPYFRSA
jgi:hypothetical protein